MRHIRWLLLGCVWCLVSVGCQGSPAAEPTTPVAAFSPTATSLPTAPPTPTPLPPPVLSEPATTTPLPTATPTPTPAATATPEPVILLTGDDFARTGRNPLTGELPADPALLNRRPIACKISNAPAEYVRPQSGLNAADLVFEHVTEGAITRFTAIFYSQTPEKVGPVRSARLIDVELPAMYDAALCYSGASIGVSTKLNSSDFRARLLRSHYPGYYRTGEDKPWEHTLYATPVDFWVQLEELQQNTPPQFGSQMAFSSLPPANGEPAGVIMIDYDGWTLVEWRWDPELQRYRRWADGVEAIDANNGQPITARNVLIVYATHVIDYNICEFQGPSSCLSFATESQIWGQGLFILFRDGQRYVGNWQRQQRNHMFTFFTNDGQPLPLQLGNSWVQVVPYHYDNAVEYTP